jgi:hypothetical protein
MGRSRPKLQEDVMRRGCHILDWAFDQMQARAGKTTHGLSR